MLRSSEARTSSSTVPPLQRRTITEEVVDRLRDLLLRGVLRPGSRIDQVELANSFGVSTVPVREALLRLQSAGLVEVVPHRGVFVSEVSVEELLDIYSTRELLEEHAARLAVQHLDASDFDTLEGLADSMQTAASKQKLDDLLALNREFHFTIYRAARRRHLLQLIEQLWDLSTRYAHLQLHTVPDRASEALYEIRSIVGACQRRDADALGWMIRYKVHQTTTGLLQHMNLPDTAPKAGSARKQPSPSFSKSKTKGNKASSKKTKTPAKEVKKTKTPVAKRAPAKKAGVVKAPAKKTASKKTTKKTTKKSTAKSKNTSGRVKGRRGT